MEQAFEEWRERLGSAAKDESRAEMEEKQTELGVKTVSEKRGRAKSGAWRRLHPKNEA